MAVNNTLDGAEWVSLGNPTGDPYTFNSQSSYILPYKQKNGSTVLIYMGDRWNYNGIVSPSLPPSLSHPVSNQTINSNDYSILCFHCSFFSSSNSCFEWTTQVLED
jgi:hypothetical protein